MNNGMYFSIDSVSVSNLEKIAMEQSELAEARICELSFIADALAEKAFSLFGNDVGIADVLALIGENNGIGSTLDTPNGTVAPRLSSGYLSYVSRMDRGAFANLLTERLVERGCDVSEGDFLDTGRVEESFTYVKNTLADEAFDVFSQEFSDPRVFYSSSIKEALAAVAEGKVGYCILPFEESGARIPSISAQISALDLKIVAITPVFGFEGTADMKYALISTAFRIPERDDMTDRYLEIAIKPSGSLTLADVMYASDHLGHGIYRVSSSADSGDSGSIYHTVIIKDGGVGFAELLVYLSLWGGEYIPLGIYKNIE